MNIFVEPLAIGSINGPRVWIICRRIGGHLDIEEAPDIVTDERSAHIWAAQRWNVPECDVTFKPTQIVEICTEKP